jgi:hypothetical protein
LLGGASFYNWNGQNKDSKTEIKEASSPINEEREKKSGFTIPSSYTQYTYDEIGFSFAYPKEWGTLAALTDTKLWGTALTPNIDNLSIGNAWLSGRFGFSVNEMKSFNIVAGKYGSTVRPVKDNGLHSWRVVENNPTTEGYTIGDTYPIKSAKNANGVTIYATVLNRHHDQSLS